MSRKSGRLTLVVSPDVQEVLNTLKNERYQGRASSEMIRDLIEAGIRSDLDERAKRQMEEHMEKYQMPSAHQVALSGSLSNDRLAALSEAELEAYLRESGYWANKKLYRVNGNYILREVAGEHVLIPTGDLPGNVMITMNQTCAFLWKQMQEPRTIGDLVAAAKEKYDDPQGELETHIREFVEYRVQTGHIWEVE